MTPRPTLLASVLVLTAAVRAQAPSPMELARKAHELAEACAKEDDADAQKALAAFVAEAERAKDWTADHFVQASSPLLHDQPAAGLAIAQAGLKLFADARFLWDHAGMAHLSLAEDKRPGAAQVAAWTAAKDAFTTALKHQPDTFHAHVGLAGALDPLGDVDGALRELAAARTATGGKEALPDAAVATLRTALLVRLGRTADALAAIDASGADDPLAAPILRLRVHALAKDAAATAAAAKALLEAEDGPRSRVEVADALFFVGDKAGAQQALAKLPAGGTGGDEEREEAQFAASGAALAAYWQAADVSAKGPLRAALTKALAHKFVVMEPAKPKPKETDLSSSPLAMAHLLTGAMEADGAERKNWGNRVLLVLCVQAAPAYKPSPFEATMLKGLVKDPFTAADVPGIVLLARQSIGDPGDACALSGVHALERLTAAPAAPVAPAKRAGK